MNWLHFYADRISILGNRSTLNIATVCRSKFNRSLLDEVVTSVIIFNTNNVATFSVTESIRDSSLLPEHFVLSDELIIHVYKI